MMPCRRDMTREPNRPRCLRVSERTFTREDQAPVGAAPGTRQSQAVCTLGQRKQQIHDALVRCLQHMAVNVACMSHEPSSSMRDTTEPAPTRPCGIRSWSSWRACQPSLPVAAVISR